MIRADSVEVYVMYVMLYIIAEVYICLGDMVVFQTFAASFNLEK